MKESVQAPPRLDAEAVLDLALSPLLDLPIVRERFAG